MSTFIPTLVRRSPSALAIVGALFAVAASLVVLYLVQFDAGQLSRAGMLLHEVMHDGRHLLGVPCH